jgi:hypothetical protein
MTTIPLWLGQLWAQFGPALADIVRRGAAGTAHHERVRDILKDLPNEAERARIEAAIKRSSLPDKR